LGSRAIQLAAIMPKSTGTLTVLLTYVLEPVAIRLTRGAIAINNALLLLLGIRALPPAGICIRLAIRPADIGLTELVLSRAAEIGRRGRSGAHHAQRSEHTSGEQQSIHGKTF
jgi:hypothetical protein